MTDAGEPQVWESTRDDLSDLFVWIGRDGRGTLLEVIAVERPDCLLVIHVMPVHYYDRGR